MSQPFTENLITLKELADYLKVTHKTIYNMIEAQIIPFYRVGASNDGGDYRFNKEKVLEALPQQKLSKV